MAAETDTPSITTQDTEPLIQAIYSLVRAGGADAAACTRALTQVVCFELFVVTGVRREDPDAPLTDIDSAQLNRIVDRFEKATGKEVKITDLFTHTTPSSMAGFLAELMTDGAPAAASTAPTPAPEAAGAGGGVGKRPQRTPKN